MTPWFGNLRDSRLVAVHLVADGAWISRSFGLLDLDAAERAGVASVAARLIEEGSHS